MILSYLKLPETISTHTKRPDTAQIIRLAKRMLTSTVLWGHILLITATNGILFGFYGEAPFLFIEQLGMRPSLFGLLGIVIASATVVAARISYCLSGKTDSTTLIQNGSYLTILGGLGFTLTQALGLVELNLLGMTLILTSLFMTFVGVGLIIPNSLSMALRDYQEVIGTAGSIFGATYYSLIALATWTMSLLHNGTAWPLPLYITLLGAILILGSQMAVESGLTTKRSVKFLFKIVNKFVI